MTKYSSGSNHEFDRPEGDGDAPPALREGGCDLYSPGHQIHYKHQGRAVRSPSLPVRAAFVDGTMVTLVLDDGRELHWRHHDRDRLGRILELLRARCVAYPEAHALRVGPYWFNCAAETDPWQECPVSRGSDQA